MADEGYVYSLEQKEHRALRNQVYDLFREWLSEGEIIGTTTKWDMPSHVCRVLGRAEHFSSGDVCTEAELAHLRALIGPHGYSYYRALLARIEHD